MVKCLTPDRGAAGSSLTGVTALCPCARHINPSLELVEPRKTNPFITERWLMGSKESNKNNDPKAGKILITITRNTKFGLQNSLKISLILLLTLSVMSNCYLLIMKLGIFEVKAA